MTYDKVVYRPCGVTSVGHPSHSWKDPNEGFALVRCLGALAPTNGPWKFLGFVEGGTVEWTKVDQADNPDKGAGE